MDAMRTSMISFKSHVKRIASNLWILFEAPKRRIYCRENIFAINFLLMIIIYADINTPSRQAYNFTNIL